jgi:sensor histidine kinase YesM
MLFHIAMVVFYVGTLLFAGSFLDPGKKHTRLHRYLHTVIMLCILYASCYRLMGTMLQENLLYVLDVFALSPILMALWLWQKGSRVALYYVIINAVYLPIYGYFLVVTQVAVMPIVPLYLLLIAGSLTESIGYSAAVAYRLYATLQHKHSIEEQNRVLRREQMESALLARDAELRMLRFQMNPHFLFNALNSLIAEIGECPKHAVNMAQKLSEYLRYTLTTRETIRVADELEAVQRYLELENFRYEDKLVVRMDVDEQIADIRIPMFTLQPLVENALKYGMQTSPMPLQVDLKVRREGNVLRIAVSNTGHWVQGQTESTGIGLQNIQERLKRNACGEGSLRWEQKKDRVEVCLIIPIG